MRKVSCLRTAAPCGLGFWAIFLAKLLQLEQNIWIIDMVSTLICLSSMPIPELFSRWRLLVNPKEVSTLASARVGRHGP